MHSPYYPLNSPARPDALSVRLWGVEQQLMLAMRLLPRGVGSLAYSSDGLRG